MMFAPHILQKKVDVPVQNDEFGQPVFVDEESWEDVCLCRCDDKSTTWASSENGAAYVTQHYIVCNGRVDIKEGEQVRCIENGKEICSGVVYQVKRLNYLGYTEVYL